MTLNRPAARGGEHNKIAGRAAARRRSTVAAFVGSLVLHVLVLLIFLPPTFDTPPKPPKKNETLEVTTTYVDPPEDPPDPDDALAALSRNEEAPDESEEPAIEEEPEEEEPDEQEEPQEQEPEEITPPTPPPEKQHKLVQQETNEEMPEDADFLSDQANKVEEETRAEETTTLDVLPGDSVPEDLKEETGGDEETALDEEEAPEDLREEAEEEAVEPQESRQDPQTPAEVAEEQPPGEQREEQSPEQREAENNAPEEAPSEALVDNPYLRKEKPSPQQPPPKGLFGPSAAEYDEMFGEADEKAAAQAKTPKKGRRLLEGWKDRERAMRASLENTITEVRPGNHTGVNAAPSVYASYIARIHRKLHPLWGGGFLPRLDSQYSAGHALSNPNLEVTLEYIIDAASGEVDAVNIVKSSGEMLFDGEGVMIFTQIGPHTHAPKEIISPDGKVYIHWTLWRDQQQCGPWGAHIYIVNDGKKKRVDTDGRAISDG